jgi:hypothetical protein
VAPDERAAELLQVYKEKRELLEELQVANRSIGSLGVETQELKNEKE